MTDQKQLRIRTRLLLSATVGLVVAFIAIVVAWQNIAPMMNIRHEQWFTQRTLEELTQAISEYQKITNSLPQKLDDLRILDQTRWLRFDENQELVDGWQRPFVYTTDGTNYTVMSFGSDGQPGGFGLDYDLTSANPTTVNAFPTFIQFLIDCPTEGILLSCILSGTLTSILCWLLVKPAKMSRKNIMSLSIKILVTIIGAVIVGSFLAMFHIPTGH